MSGTETAAETRELPILMHARSVRGILDGRKSVTRRIVKPQPVSSTIGGQRMWTHERLAGSFGEHIFGACLLSLAPSWRPYGDAGDLLWVRETWTADFGHAFSDRPDAWWHEMPRSLRTEKAVAYIYYAADGSVYHGPWHGGQHGPLHESGWEPDENDLVGRKWQPSIFMPKWAARLWLRVTDVRVERVQEISTEDIRAEGVKTWLRDAEASDDLRAQFRQLWDDTNGDEAWERNDWVWAVTFERTEAP